MGPYCNFCGRRCFLPRQVYEDGLLVWSGIMATCARGRQLDIDRVGVDVDSAFNPAGVQSSVDEHGRYCQVEHIDYRSMAQCIWKGMRVVGNGRHALAIMCGIPMIILYESRQRADEVLDEFVTDSDCAGGSHLMHELKLPAPAATP